ncbi:MAG: hypothetical protein KJ063_24900, partial [Anaerolineae bacterium]|nr:hypothetical protein [Anaerolineae bacterium]
MRLYRQSFSVPAANDSRTVTAYPFLHYEVEQAYTWQYNCTGGCRWKWELTNSIIRRTYFLGGQAVATRIIGDPANDGLFYLHGDHLGSTSLLTYGSSPGNMVPGTETRYLPYGAHRLAHHQLTERDYTGQKENLELRLLYYNARFYLPGIGRFA